MHEKNILKISKLKSFECKVIFIKVCVNITHSVYTIYFVEIKC